MGYDGYGVKKIIDNKTLEEITNSHCIIEELIDIKKENLSYGCFERVWRKSSLSCG